MFVWIWLGCSFFFSSMCLLVVFLLLELMHGITEERKNHAFFSYKKKYGMRCGRRRFFPYCCSRKIAVSFVDHPFTIHCYNGTNINETFSQDYVSPSVNGENYFFFCCCLGMKIGVQILSLAQTQISDTSLYRFLPFFCLNMLILVWNWTVSCCTYWEFGDAWKKRNL